jgi:hypothetical protein
MQQQANLARWAEQQEENARKMEILDAMDRFPRALKVGMIDRMQLITCYHANVDAC